jgi:hypothetical protein
MSKLVGLLRGKKIYDNDPLLVRLQCDVEYIPIHDPAMVVHRAFRCDFCGRTSDGGNECRSCGALL